MSSTLGFFPLHPLVLQGFFLGVGNSMAQSCFRMTSLRIDQLCNMKNLSGSNIEIVLNEGYVLLSNVVGSRLHSPRFSNIIQRVPWNMHMSLVSSWGSDS